MKTVKTKLSLLVIAPRGLDTGFRLGGALVKTVPDRSTLNREIELVLKEKEVGILAVPESMKNWINEPNLSGIQQSMFPILVHYRFPEEMEFVSELEEEVAEIVQKAIGYRLNIRLQ